MLLPQQLLEYGNLGLAPTNQSNGTVESAIPYDENRTCTWNTAGCEMDLQVVGHLVGGVLFSTAEDVGLVEFGEANLPHGNLRTRCKVFCNTGGLGCGSRC